MPFLRKLWVVVLHNYTALILRNHILPYTFKPLRLNITAATEVNDYIIIKQKCNSFTKTLLFCANFLRKMTKIKTSDQLLYFVILCTLFQIYVKHIAHKQVFNNVIRFMTTLFEINCFTKTLLFCANFLWKMTKIKTSNQLLYFVILCTLFQIYIKHIAHKQGFSNVIRYDNII
jgi:hypothetical protein